MRLPPLAVRHQEELPRSAPKELLSAVSVDLRHGRLELRAGEPQDEVVLVRPAQPVGVALEDDRRVQERGVLRARSNRGLGDGLPPPAVVDRAEVLGLKAARSKLRGDQTL